MLDAPIPFSLPPQESIKAQSPQLVLDGKSLSIEQVTQFIKKQHHVSLCKRVASPDALQVSCDVMAQQLNDGKQIYGVNTLFGGLANLGVDDPIALQQELITSHHSGAGNDLAIDDVRVAMLLRVNSLAKGASGIRHCVLQRYLDLLNLSLTPRVKTLGSIGASGDLIPLATIAAAALGILPCAELHDGSTYRPANEVLAEHGLEPIQLNPKEGLALINGTACLTAIATTTFIRYQQMFSLHMACQSAVCEIMEADSRAFHPLIHELRPHQGQITIAKWMRERLDKAPLVRSPDHVESDFAQNELIQDRYSIRCIPQYLGPIYENMQRIKTTLTIEMNSVTDNPIVDTEGHTFLHGGNFLGQHISLAMDTLRVDMALLAKHNEAQVATLVEPAFSRGLTACLVTPAEVGKRVGVKPLQILMNSICPLLEQKASPLSVHFPVHAEQFNQNLNSQGFGSAQLTQSAGHLLKTHLAASLIIYLQAAYIRADQKHLSIDSAFSPSTRRLIRVFCELNGLSLTDNWAVLSGVRNELKQAFVANVENGIDTFAFEFTQDAVSSAQTDEKDL